MADLYPLLIAETQKLITNPAVAQDYLNILKGIVEAAMVRLGLVALATQKEQHNNTLRQRWLRRPAASRQTVRP